MAIAFVDDPNIKHKAIVDENKELAEKIVLRNLQKWIESEWEKLDVPYHLYDYGLKQYIELSHRKKKRNSEGLLGDLNSPFSISGLFPRDSLSKERINRVFLLLNSLFIVIGVLLVLSQFGRRILFEI